MKSDSICDRPKSEERSGAVGAAAADGEADGDADREAVFAVLSQLVGPLGRSLPGPVEIVLHDLAALPNSIVAIEGDVTGRRPGDPATDRLLETAASGSFETRTGYRTTSPSGRSLLSTTIVIRDAAGRPAAALCINRDVTDWQIIGSAARSILGENEAGLGSGGSGGSGGVGGVGGVGQNERNTQDERSGAAALGSADGGEAFVHDVDELAAAVLRQAVAEQDVPVSLMRKAHKVEAVRSLKRRGFFMLRDAVEMAAQALGVTRFTIYNYLNEIGESADRQREDGKPPASSASSIPATAAEDPS
jgi:hypothetical protein